MQRRTNTKKDNAVSPVVGVMLMLVVTIIIAAVVSVFAGGLMTNQQAAPSLTMDITIKNSGYYGSSSFLAKVMSVSEPIATKDLKITTSWSTTNKTNVVIGQRQQGSGMTDVYGYEAGIITGGATVTGTAANTFGWDVGFNPASLAYNRVAPWGYGNGILEANSGIPNAYSQQYGNYTLIGGVNMYAYPAGQSGGFGGSANSSAAGGYGIGVSDGTTGNGGQYSYTNWAYKAGENVDGMQAVLGENWQYLRSGDRVNVKVTYLPTGAVIYDSNVVVS
ncbi:MAG: type IV pilin N-terminal domain-containing protein [Methanocorpusculum sp.]|nr:type IV pilin N-terminal domain-containing protein [Methanocorpusculum sp.]MDE2524757.1 type IV pilin N-terminal domain-containing protein [Methanocorpusculum sp.]